MGSRVLVAEDNVKQAALVRLYLEEAGYEVDVIADGQLTLDAVRVDPPDLLVLDGMLPTIDGLDVCRTIRSESDLPVLMLTARSSERDMLLGLDLGADDYMTKPFSPAELVTRVRTLLRRIGSPTRRDLVVIGALEIDAVRHLITLAGTSIECTPAEFRLMEILAKSAGQVFTRSQLLGQLHGIDQYITERTIDVHVKNLRKKFEKTPGDPRLLLTVYGIGYKLQAPVDVPN